MPPQEPVKPNVRAAAAQLVHQVIQQGRSLRPLLQQSPSDLSVADRSLLQALCYGTLRWLPRLEWSLQQLMATSLLKKQPLLHYLLLVGGYQLLQMRLPPYAVIHESVNAARILHRPQLTGLINGVLRQWVRQQALLNQKTDQPQAYHTLHPDWLVQRLQQAYPQQWQQIIESNNQQPPLWLRVNQQRITREAYVAQLQASGMEVIRHPTLNTAIALATRVPVTQLPGFAEGLVTVQDSAAQQCVPLLDPQAGERILDLCAAPGGKTTHLLEYAPEAQVIAVDQDAMRLQRLAENVQRLRQSVEWLCGDALQPHTWGAGRQFHRILLDAPCSATGVIRRHPDIKWLRRAGDIIPLVEQQQAILRAIWPYLKPGGVLLYATCSLLPEENQQQIERFLRHEATAQGVAVGEGSLLGWQVLPQPLGGDGFFYAKLIKQR